MCYAVNVKNNWGVSSVGSEHLVYTQGVTGSNPVLPTKKRLTLVGLFLYLLFMYYCYILYSQKLDKFYVGSTGDFEGRLQRHNSLNRGFTSTGKPWELKYYGAFEEKCDAIKREAQLKRWKSRGVILKLIKDS